VRLDHLVYKVKEELTEHRDGLVQLVTVDHVDLMDLRVNLDSQALRVRKVELGSLEVLSLVLLDLWDHRDLLAVLDSLDLEEVLV